MNNIITLKTQYGHIPSIQLKIVNQEIMVLCEFYNKNFISVITFIEQYILPDHIIDVLKEGFEIFEKRLVFKTDLIKCNSNTRSGILHIKIFTLMDEKKFIKSKRVIHKFDNDYMQCYTEKDEDDLMDAQNTIMRFNDMGVFVESDLERSVYLKKENNKIQIFYKKIFNGYMSIIDFFDRHREKLFQEEISAITNGCEQFGYRPIFRPTLIKK